ncbi:PucR family transcriptional regulator ligand-binding domain-containing protein [Streptacidiphilus monticola]
MFPTVSRVLDLEVVSRGLPEVVAGKEHLENPVRWVHVSELPDVAGMLQGGELILSTGIALPEHREGLARYVQELAEVGAAGLVIEFGRRYFDSLPRALVHAAEQRGLPLIVLRRELRFVAVTEAVHALVVNAQLEELRSSEEIHQTFNELAVEGPSRSRWCARWRGWPVRRWCWRTSRTRCWPTTPRARTPKWCWPAGSPVRARSAPAAGPGTTRAAAGWSPRSARAARTGAGWC